LLLDESYPPELLEGFDVVREPQDDVVAALTMLEPRVGDELFAQLPALRVVGTATVGFDQIDVDAAEARGIDIVSVPDYCTQEVALDAVLAALRSGRLGGAALDVLPQEPPPVPPVASNLILTPHAAYYSAAAEERAYRLCLARFREVLGFA